MIEPWPSVGHVYATVAAEHGYPDLDADQLTARFRAAWRGRSAFDYSRPAWSGLVSETFRGILARPPAPDFFDALYRRFASSAVWRVFEEVPSTLAQLSGLGVKLGIVSNWDERLRPMLDDLRLAPSFEVIVISTEEGFTKPSRELFHRAAERLGVAPANVLHVGDSAAEDVAGARGAGMRAVRLKRAAGGTSVPGLIHDLMSLGSLLDNPP